MISFSLVQRKNYSFLKKFILPNWSNRIIRGTVNLIDNAISYQFGKLPLNCDNASYSPLTIGQLLKRSCQTHPDRTACIVAHQNIEKTYQQLLFDVQQLTFALHSIGCTRGSLVGLWAINNYEWLLTQFATAILGSILVTINPGYKEQELFNCLKLVPIDTLIMSQSFKTSNFYRILDNITPGLFINAKSHSVQSKKLPSLKNLIVIDQEEQLAPSNACRFSELIQRQSIQKSIDWNREMTEFDDVINIQFTSGTTGTPKGSMLTHHNIIQNVQFISSILFEHFAQNPIICLPNPLYHTFGCVVGSATSLYNNATLVLPAPVFNATQTMQAIDKYKCNYLYGTPTMWSDIIHSSMKQFGLSTLKRGIMSGAQCSPILLEKVRKQIPSLEHILIPYGATETGPVATCTSIKDSQIHQLKSVGLPIPFVEIKIIDMNTGRTLARGQSGEICIRSHGTFPGYFNQPDKTKEVIDANFWYHTGDVGCMDQDGYLYINGRIKEMIIRGGENIYPREVEELILNFEKNIQDVQIVGIPDERLGEEMVAYVLLKNDQVSINEENLKQNLKDKISHFKVPKHICFVKDYPRTASGKIQKFQLKKMAIEQFQ